VSETSSLQRIINTLSHIRYLLVTLCVSILLQGETLAAPFHEISEVAEGIYLQSGIQEDFSGHNRGHIANKGFILGREAVAVIDTGSSYREGLALRKKIREITRLPIKYVILTHMHPDHVLGASAFKQDDPLFVGHEYLRDALERRVSVYLKRMSEILGVFAEGTEMVYPSKTVSLDQAVTLDLGGRELLLSAYPTGHTNNDITVYDSATETLWLSDLLFVERIPVMDGSLLGWIGVIDNFTHEKCTRTSDKKPMINLATRDGTQCIAVERVVPGHGPIVNEWKQALENERRYLAHLRDGIREVIKRGQSISLAVETVALEERDKWLLFDLYHGRNVTAGFVELEWE
jgi:quinoprotein relay system zinc metallohydrolase 2